jgi:zinc transporter
VTEEFRSSNSDDDHKCFVFGRELNGEGGATQCSGDAPSSGAQWLHIDYSAADAEQWLAARGLNPLVIETLVRQETRPRTLATEEGLLVVLRGINMNPNSDPSDMVSVRLWIEPGRVISVRQRRILAADDIREDLDAGRGPRDVPALIVDLVERIADRIANFVDEMEEAILDYEAKVESSSVRSIRSELAVLRRETAVVRRFVAPLREALEGLARQAEQVLDAKRIYAIRDQSDRITRAVEDLDLVRERASVVQEELLNRLSQEQNDRLYLFSVVAAIFLPITFITGLFGMNTAGLPGLDEPWAFWLVIIGMIVVTVTIVLYLRSRKWF